MGVAESSNVAGNRYKNAGNRTFNGMAEDTAAANRASNGVGTDSRRIRLVQLLGLHLKAAVRIGTERRVQSERK